jgi:hypothetical protein
MPDDDQRNPEQQTGDAPEHEPMGPGTTAGGGEVRGGRRVDPDDEQRPTPQQERVERVDDEEARTYQESGRRAPAESAPEAAPRQPAERTTQG